LECSLPLCQNQDNSQHTILTIDVGAARHQLPHNGAARVGAGLHRGVKRRVAKVPIGKSRVRTVIEQKCYNFGVAAQTRDKETAVSRIGKAIHQLRHDCLFESHK
jgi:hypothetical protein